jgi:hypothetical protein
LTRATEIEMDTNPREGRTLRTFMSIGAALCVLGLASLVFLHAPDTTMAMTDASAPTDVGAPFGAAPGTGATNVPSAETVFRDKGYVAPEVPIAQF